jgi:hypothetical protein
MSAVGMAIQPVKGSFPLQAALWEEHWADSQPPRQELSARTRDTSEPLKENATETAGRDGRKSYSMDRDQTL